MKNKLDPLIVESDELLKKGTLTLAKNIGKITAITVALVAILLTFTDVSLTELGGESFTLSAALLLLASYLMYFSLEDAGEGLGEESEEYIAAIESYENIRDKIQGANAVRLRDFCIRYSVNELEYRRKSYLWRNAVSEEEYKDYLNGKVFKGEKKRIMKRAQRLRAVPISPTDLLTGDRSIGKSELKSPERTKLLRLCTRLIPTTLCTCLTFSVMLTAKEDLNAAAVIEGILKLSALPIVGLRGYASGYGYVKNTMIPWIKTKERILLQFIEEEKQKSNAALLTSDN